MHVFWRVVRRNILLVVFFLSCSVLLWLGDGHPWQADAFAAYGVVFLFLCIPRYMKKQRPMDTRQMILGCIALLYVGIQTFFSDDIGTSLVIFLRYLDVACMYYLFFSYSSVRSIIILIHSIIGFAFFALGSALSIIVFPQLGSTLPLTNLLKATYGHNTVIIPILFAFAPNFYLWIETKQRRYALIAALLCIASILTFARSAVGIEIVCVIGITIMHTIQKKRVRYGEWIIMFLVVILGMSLWVVPAKIAKSQTLFFSSSFKQLNPIPNGMSYWRQAVEAIRMQPITGYGAGTFYFQSIRFQTQPQSYSWYPHNIVLNMVVNLGIVGTILVGLFLWSIIRSVQQSRMQLSVKHTRPIIACLLGLSSIVAYGMVDFPLNYIVPFMLFWAMTGALAGVSLDQRKKSDPHWKSGVMRAIILAIFVLNSLLLLDQWSTYKFKLFPCEHFRGFATAVCLIQHKNDEAIPQWEYQIYQFLHKNNYMVLSALATKRMMMGETEQAKLLYKRAAMYNRFDPYILHRYLQLLTNDKQYDQVGKELTTTLCQLYGTTVCGEIQQLPLTKPVFIDVYQTVFSEPISTIQQNYPIWLYRFGLAFLETNPELTRLCWTIVRDMTPDTGVYYSELAGLYWYTLNQPDKAQEILQTCQIRPMPALECKLRQTEGLEPPGTFKQTIFTQLQ